MFLSGTLTLRNHAGEQVPVAAATSYTAFGEDAEDRLQPFYDFNNDGRFDTVVAGAMVAVDDGSGAMVERFVEERSLPAGTEPVLQGVYLSGAPEDPTVQPDLIRVMDQQARLEPIGTLATISALDLRNTDIYFFRESTGQLIVERRGLKSGEVLSSDVAATGQVNYRTSLRSPADSKFNRALSSFWSFSDWAAMSQLKGPYQSREADHIRMGEYMRVVAINRATGYTGTTRFQILSNLQGAGALDYFIPPITMVPPNLKIWAERGYEVDKGLTAGDTRTSLIGAEGAALSDDTTVTIFTEWLDESGRPLPEALGEAGGAQYGLTGRLAKITAPNVLRPAGDGSRGDDAASFPIGPGRTTQMVQVGSNLSAPEHFYVHVIGKPINQECVSGASCPSFDISGTTPPFDTRPALLTPFLTPLFDEDSHWREYGAYRQLKKDNPDLTAPPPAYSWHYRPEYQFSRFELEMQEINRVTSDEDGTEQLDNILDLTNPLITAGDELLRIFYSLFGPEFAPLTPIDGTRELVLAIGEEEQLITIGADQSIEFENLDHLSLLDPEDLLTIRLYANNDAANILWEFAFGTLEVAVDLNRDGKLDFSQEPDDPGLSDVTSPERPYRFWVNNDYDVVQHEENIISNVVCPSGTIPGSTGNKDDHAEQTCEQVDITTGLESASNISSENLSRIESLRDLEDFAPLAIRIPAGMDSLFLKFRASNPTIGINVFKGTWRDDGEQRAHSYVFNREAALDQVMAANDNGRVLRIHDIVPVTMPIEQVQEYFDKSGVGRFIFEATSTSYDQCGNDASTCYVLVELWRQDNASVTKVTEQKLYVDFHDVTEFYHTITAGPGADGSVDGVLSGPLEQIHDDPHKPYRTHIYEGLFPPEELHRDYALFVHGWRVTDAEKTAMADTVFKRLYWSGYKGTFGTLTWPTGWFDRSWWRYGSYAQLEEAWNDLNNYDDSEVTARLAGMLLGDWLEAFVASDTYENVHLISHSMGGVVASEALLHYDGIRPLASFTPSQSSASAGGYNQQQGLMRHAYRFGVVAEACGTTDDGLLHPYEAWQCYDPANFAIALLHDYGMPPDRYRYEIPLTHGPTTDDAMAASNIGHEYYRALTQSGNKTTRFVNLFNYTDSALSQWELNQVTKPSNYAFEPADEIGRWSYEPDIRPNIVSPVEAEDTFFHILTEYVGGEIPIENRRELIWPENVDQPITRDKAEILAYITPSRTHALGQSDVGAGIIASVNLFRDFDFSSSNPGHSQQFNSYYAKVRGYWNEFVRASMLLDARAGTLTGLYED
jgi:pimeloyl-ACP methyl ester carboxylesterase